MPTSENPTMSEDAGTSVHLHAPSGADVVEEVDGEGTEAPAENAKSEEQSPDPGGAPRSASPNLDDWFDLLRRSTVQMASEGAIMTAAGVSIRMRRLDSRFTPEVAGFRTFGYFLRAAASANVVEIAFPEQTGKVDIMVSVPRGDSSSDTSLMPTLASKLWNAFTDWNPGAKFAWNRRSGEIRRILSQELHDGEIMVPTIGRDNIIRWMSTFLLAEGVNDPLVDDADTHPGGLLRLIRATPSRASRWQEAFRKHVLPFVDEWRTSNKLTWDDLSPRSAAIAGRPHSVADSTHVDGDRHPARVSSDTAADLRAQVLAAVHKMPLTELLRLPIPIEYLLL